MSEKSLWESITHLMSGKDENTSTVRQLNTHTRKCAAGHPMAVDWTVCPYCNLNENSSRSTRAEGASSHAEPLASQAAAGGGGAMPPPGRRPTQVFEPDGGGQPHGSAGGRVTKVFQEADDNRPAYDPVPAGRLLTGVLFTYSWSKLGQLFPLYAGRNYVGTASSTRDGDRTEVLVTEDTTMSSTHFLVLHQAGRYLISDCLSTNGTFIDGQQVSTQGIELRDNAEIKSGNTIFVFKKIQPPGV